MIAARRETICLEGDSTLVVISELARQCKVEKESNRKCETALLRYILRCYFQGLSQEADVGIEDINGNHLQPYLKRPFSTFFCVVRSRLSKGLLKLKNLSVFFSPETSHFCDKGQDLNFKGCCMMRWSGL